MIQVIVQREYKNAEGKEAVAFVYPESRVGADTLSALFRGLADVLSKLKEDERVNAFYTLAHHSGAGLGELPKRSATTFEYQTVMAFDFDEAEVERAFEYAAVVAETCGCPVEALTVIKSGGGVHILIGLKAPIRQAKYFRDMRQASRMMCDELNKRLGLAGLKGYADKKVFDPARVLRLPGTINRKRERGADLLCELVQIGNATLDFDLAEVSGYNKAKKDNVSPEEIKRKFPTPDFAEMVKECGFVRWCHKEVTQVHEPDAFDLFSLLHHMPEAATATVGEQQYTPKSLAQYVYDNATASNTLRKEPLDKKLEQAGKYGSRTCKTVNDRWGQCATCPHFGKIPTPLALRSKEHVGTEETGYWVLDSKGRRVTPHYGDLERIFRGNHHYKVTSEERIFCFEDTHYSEWQKNQVKHWLEQTVTPNDPLREGHRTEMVAKIRATNVISKLEEKQFFDNGLRGKLNCANGVVDIMTSTLSPHSPEYGFMSVLPYDWVDGEKPEYFLNWLDVVSEGNQDRQTMMLGTMEYTLFPAYDDHVFIYLTGTGGNGKSTFMEVMKAMVGKDNYTSASLSQLVDNRFAPAQLEGKMMNISEEESGTTLGIPQLNYVKNASAGGTMMVERKGMQMFEMRNSAKLIFSANKIPRFEDDTQSVKRRLVVIEFNYQIPDEKKDPRVLDRIIEEMPAILSMLVRRIRANIQANGGVYRFPRGGETGVRAQENFMTASSTAMMFAHERLECSESLDDDQCLSTKEVYGEYQQWCSDNGHKYPMAKENFSKAIQSSFMPVSLRKLPNVRKIAKKNTRVFLKTRWKTEGEVVE